MVIAMKLQYIIVLMGIQLAHIVQIRRYLKDLMTF